MGNKSGNVAQSNVSVDEVLKQPDKINCNTRVVPAASHSRAPEEVRDEIAELLTALTLL